MDTRSMKCVSSRRRLKATGGGTKLSLLAFFLGIFSSVAAADVFVGVRVSRFLQQDSLDTCNEGILLADENGDGALDSSEFTTLVETLSEGAISVDEIAELPLRLRTVYFLTACLCALEPGAESDCCVGDNSEIAVEEIDSEDPTVENRVFCSEVTKGIADVKEDLDLTPAPATASPTMALSPVTVSPSMASPSTSASPTMMASSPTSASPTTMASSPASANPSPAPTDDPSLVLPTVSPSQNSTIAPSPSPVPPETLCIGFQYEVINNQSLTADDIMNEVDNSLKSGLIEATRTTVINILNETYPRSNGGSFQPPPSNQVSKSIAEQDNVEYLGQIMYYPENDYRKLLQVAEEADAFVMDVDLATYREEMEDEMSNLLNILSKGRRLYYIQDTRTFLRHARRLVYYSDEFPVEITQIVESTICPGQTVGGDFINCAVVSSTVCVVLEEGDDPVEVRATIVNGLEEAFMNGDFTSNIPTGSRRMRR